MAIYHCSIKIISRGKGKPAVAAAYRVGEKIKMGVLNQLLKRLLTEQFLCYTIVIDHKSLTIVRGGTHKLARPVKKPPEQWENEILSAAQKLFLSKGYEETSITDIMEEVGGAKGMFYRFFQSKEEIMKTMGDRMFFENNPFEAIKGRTDLNGLQKIRELLVLNQSDTERENLNVQAIPILKDPRILAAAIEANRRVLTPLWFELLEEARRDGSIQSEYTKELSELLPLINFWFMPSVYPATAGELRHKYFFIMEVLAKMGLPLMDGKTMELAEQFLTDISPKQ